ncbi:MAG: hypothetical protein AMK70_13140 [Nitrospira bacterium SG8_35_1]|nr:MAG: hypothetical protein AMK70_13140 [Nitrospira bacterium SG8_35_1]
MQKADTKEQQEISARESLSDKKLQDARQVINIFILAWKNYGLYPEDHVSTVNSFKNLLNAFGNYFSTHEDLRLNVEKDRLLCKSELIHEVSPEAPTEDIITLLYRDGIKWIEFQEGLTLEEIASLYLNISISRQLTFSGRICCSWIFPNFPRLHLSRKKMPSTLKRTGPRKRKNRGTMKLLPEVLPRLIKTNWSCRT